MARPPKHPSGPSIQISVRYPRPLIIALKRLIRETGIPQTELFIEALRDMVAKRDGKR